MAVASASTWSNCRRASGAAAKPAPTMGSDGPCRAGEEQASMSGVLDARDRDEAMRRLAAGPLDVLVIGGGITGAGAALDAASRGLRVGLSSHGTWRRAPRHGRPSSS